jgi:hypothetical protein
MLGGDLCINMRGRPLPRPPKGEAMCVYVCNTYPSLKNVVFC